MIMANHTTLLIYLNNGEITMKIGILGAMLEEVSSIKNLMNITNEKEIGSRVYIEGSISDIEVVLTFSRWGKVASSSTTTTLINLFNVNFVLFTGVAGAVSPDLNIGDIVISKGLYQHDMDARPIFDQFQIPLTNTLVFEPEKENIAKVTVAAEKFLSEIEEKIPSELLSKFSIFQPQVYSGLIASGDKFIHDPKNHDELTFKYNNSETLAVEMEGAAVAQVCSEHNVPYIIVRTISDKADHSASIDFQSFIENISSKYSEQIVSNFFNL